MVSPLDIESSSAWEEIPHLQRTSQARNTSPDPTPTKSKPDVRRSFSPTVQQVLSSCPTTRKNEVHRQLEGVCLPSATINHVIHGSLAAAGVFTDTAPRGPPPPSTRRGFTILARLVSNF
ncbi:hypothetical protein AAY473_016831 [Plecturocebus cupreus]